MIVDIFLAVYFSMIGIHYTAVTLGMRHRDGQSRIHYGAAGSTPWRVRWMFNFFRASILGVCLLRLALPSIDDSLLYVFEFNGVAYVRYAGSLLMLISLFMISYTHAYMKDQWHSGIDTTSCLESTIVNTGPFRICRHPLFSAIIVGMLGFFLALPSVFTLVCLLVGAGCLVIQAEQEEKHLQALESYRQYQSESRKWPLKA